MTVLTLQDPQLTDKLLKHVTKSTNPEQDPFWNIKLEVFLRTSNINCKYKPQTLHYAWGFFYLMVHIGVATGEDIG